MPVGCRLMGSTLPEYGELVSKPVVEHANLGCLVVNFWHLVLSKEDEVERLYRSDTLHSRFSSQLWVHIGDEL